MVHEVGIVQNVIVNKTTQHVIDGHMRIALALREEQSEIPITYVELTEDEEKLVLSSYDYISTLAGIDARLLDDLLQSVNSDQPAVQEMLAELSDEATISLLGEAADSKSKSKRQLGDPSHAITCVLYVDELSIFESAILATGLVNRGHAILEICKAYLDAKR